MLPNQQHSCITIPPVQTHAPMAHRCGPAAAHPALLTLAAPLVAGCQHTAPQHLLSPAVLVYVSLLPSCSMGKLLHHQCSLCADPWQTACMLFATHLQSGNHQASSLGDVKRHIAGCQDLSHEHLHACCSAAYWGRDGSEVGAGRCWGSPIFAPAGPSTCGI